MDCADIVQRRLDAYNAHDLALFLSVHSEQILVFRPPQLEPIVIGKGALGAYYTKHRFNRPGLRADLLQRIVIGNKVIDHERIWAAQPEPFEVVVAHAVLDERIACTWFFVAEAVRTPGT